MSIKLSSKAVVAAPSGQDTLLLVSPVSLTRISPAYFAKASDLTAKANLSGGNSFQSLQTFTGPTMLTAPQGASAETRFGRGGTAGMRWTMAMNGSAESGSNAGSDYGVYRFADDGAYLAAAMQISRQNGEVVFPGGMVNSPLRLVNATLQTLPSASVYTGFYITVTNATGGRKMCVSDGTKWLIVNTTQEVN